MQEVEAFSDKVARARSGDVQAMNEILAFTRAKVIGSFLRNLRFDADRSQDLAQEFTIRLWRAVPRMRTEFGFWKTVWAVARGVVADEHRRRREPRYVPFEELADVPCPRGDDPGPGEGGEPDANPMTRALRSALDLVPRRARSLLFGQLAGQDHRTLAYRRRISRACIKTRLYRQRQRIRELVIARIRVDGGPSGPGRSRP
jgi:DNA-directed RNA polymerase specialized sigma24 family protein